MIRTVGESAEIDEHRARVTRRLLPPGPTDRVAGWVGALAVTALAGFLRFWELGQPRVFIFDETYYAKDAYGLLQHGYEQDFVDKADERILRGNLDVFSDTASYVVHPPLGKWIIAAGEQLFGMNPFGWRVAVAVLGTLSVLLLARLVRRMTGSTVLGTIAGFLLAIDGLHLVMSRTALLDLPLSFFLLAAFGALVLDREHGRRRAAARLDDFESSDLGPGFGFRPWRIVGRSAPRCCAGHQVERPLLRRCIRSAHRLVGRLGASGVRCAQSVAGLPHPRCPSRVPVHRADRNRHLRHHVVGVALHQWRLLPDVGQREPVDALRLGPRLFAVAVALPRRGVALPHRADQ